MNDRGPYWKNRVATLKLAHRCSRCSAPLNVAETRACCCECRKIQSEKEKAARRTLSTNEKERRKGFVVL